MYQYCCRPKRTKFALLTAVVLGSLFLIFSFPAYAITVQCPHGKPTFNDKVLVGGMKDATYWIPPNEFDRKTNVVKTEHIKAAMNRWSHASKYISFKKGTSKKAKVRFYNEAAGFQSNNVLAQTHFFNSKGKEMADWSKANHARCSVQIAASRFKSLTKNERIGTVVHELGHVAGLSHRNKTPKSVMCQMRYKRTAQTPSSSDAGNIAHLYK